MKHSTLYLFLFLTLTVSCDTVKDLQPAQNLNEIIPESVVRSLKASFPEAKQVRLSVLEKSKVFQSDFDNKSDKMSVVIDAQGTISEIYKETSESTLPEGTKMYLLNNYKDFSINSVKEQITQEAKILGFRVLLKNEIGTNTDLFFDKTGTVTFQVADDRDKSFNAPPPKIFFVSINDIPNSIHQVLRQNHGDFEWIKTGAIIENEIKKYLVLVAKDLVSYDYLFDEKGNVLRKNTFGINAPANLIEDKNLNYNDLNAKILNYLNKELNGWKFEKGIVFYQNDKIQGFNIIITYLGKQYALLFDESSNYLKTEQLGYANIPQKKANNLKKIEVKDLPFVISNYFNQKYQNFKYLQASIIQENNKKIYWILIFVNNTTIDFTFDETGKVLTEKEINFKFPARNVEQKNILLTELPKIAIDFLDKNYPKWIFNKAISINDSNKIIGYLVSIKIGNDTYTIQFDENAKFLAARRA